MSGFVSTIFNGIGSFFNGIGSFFSSPDEQQNPYNAVASDSNNRTTSNTTNTGNKDEIDKVLNARRGIQ